MEVTVREALPILNPKAELGRVVVIPMEYKPEDLRPRETKKIYMCCDRAYLTWESFQSHRRNGCRGEGFDIDEFVGRMKRKREEEEGEEDGEGNDGGSDTSNLVANQIRSIPVPRYRNTNMIYQLNNERELVPYDNSKWVLSDRKRSCLRPEDKLSDSDLDEDMQEPIETTEKPVQRRQEPVAGTPVRQKQEKSGSTGVDIMSLVNLDISSGSLMLSCKICTFSSGETGVITEHVKEKHPKLFFGSSSDDGDQSQSQAIVSNVTNLMQETPIIKKEPGTSSNVITCDLCNLYTTQFSKNLVNHKQNAHVINGIRCEHCSCSYKSQTGLSQHITAFHGSKNTSPKRKQKPLKPSLTCKLCDYPFKAPHRLRSHMESSHVPNGKYPCYACCCVFQSQPSRQMHINKIHRRSGEVPVPYEDDVAPPPAPETSQLVERWVEDTLNQSHDYSDDDEMNEIGLQGGEDSMSTEISKTSSSTNQTNEEAQSNVSALTCDLCGYSAYSKGELNSHLKNSHVIFGVECICGCSFATATELTNHKNNTCPKSRETFKISNVVSMASPPPETPIKSPNPEPVASTSRQGMVSCPCGQTFNSRSELVKHKRWCQAGRDTSLNISSARDADDTKTDEPECTVQCPECDKWFKNEKGLLCHKASIHENTVYYDHCEICGARTPSFLVYKTHKKHAHHKDGIQCPECSCTFKQIEGLTGHFYQIHRTKLDKASLLKRCKKCDFTTYKSSDLQRHQKMGHTVKTPKAPKEKTTIQCDLCPFASHFKAVEDHKKTNHVEDGFECSACNNKFATQLGRRCHFSAIHKGISYNPDDEQDKTLRKCDLCDFSTYGLTHFEKHCEKNHIEGGFQCTFCNNSFASDNGLRGHIAQFHKQEVDYSKCAICGYATFNKKNYTHHMKSCHVKDGFRCPKCKCSFKSVEGVCLHAKMLHKTTIDKSIFALNCEHCDYKTLHPANLSYHAKTVHSLVKSADGSGENEREKCPICEAEMASCSLPDHMKRAHVEGGHRCHKCNCSFGNPQGLRQHVYQRHGEKLKFQKEYDTSIYVESCSRCDLRFKTIFGLNAHCIKKHGFSIDLPKTIKGKKFCRLCKASFWGSLSLHIKNFHVENGFKCLHCCCSFETSAARDRHMVKTHHVRRSKICSICRNKFTGTLKLHLKKCHVTDGVKCDYCVCTFESISGKYMHERKIHQQFAKRRCDLCNLDIRVTLAKHMKRCHYPNGEACNYCPCTFETEQGKIQHLKVRHKVTVRLQKICNLCGLTPSVPMKYHLDYSHVTNGVKCTHCSCSFRSHLSKNRHLQHYHGIKGLVCHSNKTCPLCGIKISYSLEKHLRLHHVSGGHPCSYCCCAFNTKLGRRVHMRMTHKQYDDPNPEPRPARTSRTAPRSRRVRLKIRKIKKRAIIKSTAKSSKNQCKLCGETVTEPMGMHLTRNHLHTNSFKCKYCISRLKTKIALNQHTLKQHKILSSIKRAVITTHTERLKSIKVKKVVKPPLAPEKVEVKVKSEPPIFGAEPSPSSLSSEPSTLPVETEPVSPIITTEPSTSSSTGEISTPAEGRSPLMTVKTEYKCLHCTRKFTTEKGLDVHMKFTHRTVTIPDVISVDDSNDSTHSDYSPEMQDDASSSGDSISVVEAAKPSVATTSSSSPSVSNVQRTCHKCGFLAASLSQLNMHLQKSHVKNSLFPCSKCSCGYATAGELDRHQRALHLKQ